MHERGCQHRVAAELEEVVVDADRPSTEHVFPDLSEPRLEQVARPAGRDVLGGFRSDRDAGNLPPGVLLESPLWIGEALFEQALVRGQQVLDIGAREQVLAVAHDDAVALIDQAHEQGEVEIGGVRIDLDRADRRARQVEAGVGQLLQDEERARQRNGCELGQAGDALERRRLVIERLGDNVRRAAE